MIVQRNWCWKSNMHSHYSNGELVVVHHDIKYFWNFVALNGNFLVGFFSLIFVNERFILFVYLILRNSSFLFSSVVYLFIYLIQFSQLRIIISWNQFQFLCGKLCKQVQVPRCKDAWAVWILSEKGVLSNHKLVSRFLWCFCDLN